MRALLNVLTVILISTTSCVLTQRPTVTEVFLLDPPITLEQPLKHTLLKGTKILIAEIGASQLIKTNSIIFGRDSMTRGKYQYSEWETPVPIRLQRIVASALQSSNQFSIVTQDPLVGIPTWKLSLDLKDFYHDAQTIPGSIVVRINANLLSPKDNTAINTATFEIRKIAQSFDAHGAVFSMNKAVTELVPKIVDWTVAEISSIQYRTAAKAHS